MKTSLSDPLRVDFLPSELLGHAGKLGMTFAPGKKAKGETALWSRDLDLDLMRLRDAYQTHTLVSLVHDYELEDLGIADLFTRARATGLSTLRLPITDGSVPRERGAVRELVARIHDITAGGNNVVVHCRGGLGRTGLIAACCLVAKGRSPASAIRAVRAARPNTLETEEQERWVHAFAEPPTVPRLPSHHDA